MNVVRSFVDRNSGSCFWWILRVVYNCSQLWKCTLKMGRGALMSTRMVPNSCGCLCHNMNTNANEHSNDKHVRVSAFQHSQPFANPFWNFISFKYCIYTSRQFSLNSFSTLDSFMQLLIKSLLFVYS